MNVFPSPTGLRFGLVVRVVSVVVIWPEKWEEILSHFTIKYFATTFDDGKHARDHRLMTFHRFQSSFLGRKRSTQLGRIKWHSNWVDVRFSNLHWETSFPCELWASSLTSFHWKGKLKKQSREQWRILRGFSVSHFCFCGWTVGLVVGWTLGYSHDCPTCNRDREAFGMRNEEVKKAENSVLPFYFISSEEFLFYFMNLNFRLRQQHETKQMDIKQTKKSLEIQPRKCYPIFFIIIKWNESCHVVESWKVVAE